MSCDSKKDKSESKNIVREGPYSYEDYASLDDGNRYELADGKLELMSPGPSVPHQIISFELQKLIAHSCEDDYFILDAPVDVILSPYEVRQPDLVVIKRERISILSTKGVEGAPDLVIEILSPSTLKRDRRDKSLVYAKYGIPEYWVVDPEHAALEIYELDQGKYTLVDVYTGDETVASRQLPCVRFTMRALMSRIPKLRN